MSNKLVPNSFMKFELTEDQMHRASMLSDDQCSLLHNIRTDLAEQTLNMLYDPEHSEKSRIEESFLKGQISMITLLLDMSQQAYYQASNQGEQ